MNDVLRTLREARPVELAPDAPVDPEVRRAELARAMAERPSGPDGARAPRARPRRALPVWGLGLAGAAAAAALVAVNLPAADGTRGDATPAAGAPVRTLDAGTVLLAAAEKAESRPAGTGAYWYVAKVQSGYYRVGEPGARYTVVDRSRHESWTPREPGGRVWGRERRLGARAATPADAALWRRAGSPSTFTLEVPVAPGETGKLKPMEASTAPGPWQTSSSPLVDGDKVFWLGRNVTMADLRALPGDPAGLKAELLRWYRGHGTEAASEPMPADAWLYRTSVGLVTDMPVTPRVRAAAFRMLAGLAPVVGAGEVVDSRGRTGDAVALDERTPLGTIRHRLVIDPATGRPLAAERVLLEPASGVDRPAGTVLSSAAVTAMEWTDSAPR
ncbi:CU044_5270 family protein [Actinomadura sp. WMMB 499]|uniref:CU044_5270 family protein n=1 Tax=Actinomadura sp. WMMB 499 TaxID=1219491 RepID=UPI0012489827|nr:CU044_5270 family protein [Actinomadura sp. WMMB 499]QFG23515.1 hypothetical protein F7P10_22740 [Actinomadura sp. WMMB 499]